MTSPITDARLKEILARAREVRESSIGATPMVAIKLMATYAAEVVPVHVVQAIVSELIAAREALNAVTDMDRSQEFRNGYRCAQKGDYTFDKPAISVHF